MQGRESITAGLIFAGQLQITGAPSDAAVALRRHAAIAIMKGVLRGAVAVGVAIAIFLSQTVSVQ